MSRQASIWYWSHLWVTLAWFPAAMVMRQVTRFPFPSFVQTFCPFVAYFRCGPIFGFFCMFVSYFSMM